MILDFNTFPRYYYASHMSIYTYKTAQICAPLIVSRSLANNKKQPPK